MRKLASVKRISDIHHIEGRDRIVLANVDGWSVIVKKDEFDIGDLCVYIEIDSVLPPKPEFEFFVPIITTEYTLPDSIDEVLSYAHGQSAIGDTLREGIVFRSHDGKRSFKAVDPLFLIKYDE